MANEIRKEIERLRIKAEYFLKENIKVFIVDIKDTYYFCDILFAGEDYLLIKNFKGIRKGEKEKLLWVDILKFEPYKKKEGENDLR